VVDALAYPALLLTAGTGVVGLLVTVVIPRFTDVLTSLGQQLPQSTRVVLAIAAMARIGLIPFLFAAGIAAAAVARWVRTPSGALAWDQALLAIPILGDIRHGYATARVSDALAALLDCGMPIARALPFAASSSGDAAIETRLSNAQQRIVEGESVARALAGTQAMTASATRLIGAGEAGGALSALLRHAATLEGDRAALRTKSLMRVIEPALILLLGAVVSGVAVALLQAVYSVRVDRL
jgi:type II secretory pathway component PulF